MQFKKCLQQIFIVSCLLFSFSALALGKPPTALFQVEESQLLLNRTTVISANMKPRRIQAGYVINIKLKRNAANKFNHVLDENKGKKLNILVNGKTISSTTIQSSLGSQFDIIISKKQNAQNFIAALRLKK